MSALEKLRARRRALEEEPARVEINLEDSEESNDSSDEDDGEVAVVEFKQKEVESLNDLPPPKIHMAVTSVCIIGEQPLIANHFPAKAIEEITEKQMGITKERSDRNIDSEVKARIVWCGEDYGFNALTFKNAIIASVRYRKKTKGDKLTKVLLQSNVHVLADDTHVDRFTVSGEEMTIRTPVVRLITEPPVTQADYVRLGGMNSGADARYRPVYPAGWKVKLRISYNSNIVNAITLRDLLAYAGKDGVGDWRPSKGGTFGVFRVADPKECW